jgi:hypothetical protein
VYLDNLCNENQLYSLLSLIDFLKQPELASGVFIANHQEVCVQQMVRVLCLGDWQLVGSEWIHPYPTSCQST